MLLAEADGEKYGEFLAGVEPAISTGTLVETLRVAGRRRGAAARSRVWEMIEEFEFEIVPVDVPQVRLAEEGHDRFGKGRGAPPAVLNFGDLFAYALARHVDAPLLFKGDDFTGTDVGAAVP